MKINSEGSYYTPIDTLNDTIKLVEEIIKDSGAADKLTIGIDCNADSFYIESTKKYEMEGFKTLPDSQGMIEFYLKFLNDHPLITYLEDPLSYPDIQGYDQLQSKIALLNSSIRISKKYKTKYVETEMQKDENKLNFLISLKLGEFITLTDIFNFKLKSGSEISIWDNEIETDQSNVIDIGFGLSSNIILLHGFNNRSERLNKINRYIELADSLIEKKED